MAPVSLLHKKQLSALALLALLLAAPAPVQASGASLKEQREASYRRLMERPSDHAETLLYTALCLRMADYESAISPLERILMKEPDNAKIRMQIGVLYKSLGSQLLARQYLDAVARDKKADASIVKQAKDHLRDL